MDIPINIQSIQITREEIESLTFNGQNNNIIDYIHPNHSNEMPGITNIMDDVNSLISNIKTAKRPVFMAGTGIRI